MKTFRDTEETSLKLLPRLPYKVKFNQEALSPSQGPDQVPWEARGGEARGSSNGTLCCLYIPLQTEAPSKAGGEGVVPPHSPLGDTCSGMQTHAPGGSCRNTWALFPSPVYREGRRTPRIECNPSYSSDKKQRREVVYIQESRFYY